MSDIKSIVSLINTILLLFSVLGLASLGCYFCNRVGIVNIAIDGQMIFGALIFVIFGQLLNGKGQGTFIIPMILAMLISVILSYLFGGLIIKLKCDHVIASTAINLLVAGVAIFINNPLGSAISAGTSPKLFVDYLPMFQIGSYSLYGTTFILLSITIIIILGSWFVLNKTNFGLRFKAVGDNPNAVDAQGLNVNKYKWIAMIGSGIVSALAGAIFIYAGPSISGSTYFEGNVGGLGFLALAIVVAGAWRIPIIALISLIFAILTRVFYENFVTFPTIPGHAQEKEYLQYIGRAIPFIGSLVVLMIFSRNSFEPKALGQHFNKDAR